MGEKSFSVAEAVKAQGALRAMAGTEPERFPVEAFVGMMSDEIERLRELGRSDEEIAAAVRGSSGIEISAEELAAHYASPEERRHGSQG